MDELLKALLDQYLAKLPFWLRPMLKDLLSGLLKKALEYLLAKSAGLPAGVQALSAVTPEQLDEAVEAALSGK